VNEGVIPKAPRTDLGYVGPSLSLPGILKMTEKEYRERYRNNQITARWINFSCIKRNALLALGNIKKQKTLPIIKNFIHDKDPIIAAAARWALKQVVVNAKN
jgi:epoxyqueuosine reductase